LALTCKFARVCGPALSGRPCLGRMIECRNPENGLPKVREKNCREDRCRFHDGRKAKRKPLGRLGAGPSYALRGILSRRGMLEP